MTDIHSTLDNVIWQDRDIRFDIPVDQLQCRRGETVLDTINAVEDTKGNNGVRGAFSVTNLRIIWCSHKNAKTNLSIGLDCIVSLSIKTVDSQLKGTTQALYVLTKYRASKFEFIFTSLVRNSPRLFTTIQAVHRAYETSRMYRDVKLRGSIINAGQLNMLPEEVLVARHEGVWNLSADQGNIGVFFITNVRVVWYAKGAENFNVSVPFIQIQSVSTRMHRGNQRVLIMETVDRGNKYVLGFRFDGQGQLDHVSKEVSTCHKLYTSKPVLGVRCVVESRSKPPEQAQLPSEVDNVTVRTDSESANMDVLYAYYADKVDDFDREPVFNEDLGLAIESLREGLSLDELWHVIS